MTCNKLIILGLTMILLELISSMMLMIYRWLLKLLELILMIYCCKSATDIDDTLLAPEITRLSIHPVGFEASLLQSLFPTHLVP